MGRTCSQGGERREEKALEGDGLCAELANDAELFFLH